jgi:hypothetical protein
MLGTQKLMEKIHREHLIMEYINYKKEIYIRMILLLLRAKLLLEKRSLSLSLSLSVCLSLSAKPNSF